jgi:hypothetical protein
LTTDQIGIENADVARRDCGFTQHSQTVLPG